MILIFDFSPVFSAKSLSSVPTIVPGCTRSHNFSLSISNRFNSSSSHSNVSIFISKVLAACEWSVTNFLDN